MNYISITFFTLFRYLNLWGKSFHTKNLNIGQKSINKFILANIEKPIILQNLRSVKKNK